MKRKMSEREAWLYLAECWDKAKIGENGYPLCAKIGNDGLCPSIETMYFDMDAIGQDAYQSMLSKIPDRRPHSIAYVWPLTMAGAKQRADFCRRMAAACAKAAKKSRRKPPKSP